MSVIGSNILAGASGQGGGYNLTKSLRFRSSAGAFLSRNFQVTGVTQATFSFWVKRGTLSTVSYLWNDTSNGFYAYFKSDNTFATYGGADLSTFAELFTTTAVFRDPSAWYHFVVALDVSNATQSNRIKVWVNGVQQSGTFSGSGYNTSTAGVPFFTDSGQKTFGANSGVGNADYYLAELNVVQGQALTPSSFGETSTSTGVWIPKKYTGTYGTNGFYLPFTDTTSTSTLGTDFSGNSNTWTVNNISLTSGSTYDSMTDVPTLTSATTANYWTLNPLNTGQLGTVQSGNLEWIGGDQNNFRTVAAQILPTTGKFYWEVTPIGGGSGGAFVSGIYIGIMNYANGGTGLFASGARIADTGKDDYVYYSDGRKVNLNSFVSYGNSYAANDVIGIAVDIDNGKIWYSKNGTWQASGDPAAGTNAAYTTVPFSTKTYAPAMSAAEITNAQKFNFGQRPFAYTPPTGFVALNTYNLPTPTIGATASSQANKYMDATLYTGTSASLSVTNAGSFQPDMVWIKSRSAATDHKLTDAIRGTTKGLIVNASGAETTDTNGLTAFNSNGFTVGTDTVYNNNTATYVAWQWNAGGSNATNTSGTITSTVRANTTAGFSIATYTGNGSTGTVGHGLGVAPSMYIVKRLSSSPYDWYTYHVSLGNTKFIRLNTTGATVTYNLWQDTTPTSSVFYLANDTGVNASSTNYVAYCFAQVAGYSAFGSYTGNGSTDGVFVYTGFRPRYVMIKCSSSAGEWTIIDSARDISNIMGNRLFAEKSNAESDYDIIDFVSNGFKLREGASTHNGSGLTYVYACFAEVPQKFSNAR